MSDLQLSHELDVDRSSFFGALQSAVTNRIENPYSKSQPIIYEETDDVALLHQYYRIRQDRYDRVFHTVGYNWGEDVYDKMSHTIIARRGRLCLGGCRLIVREGDENWAMPMESDDFKLRETFPKLRLDKVRHAEVSRFAVMDDCSDESDDIIYGLYKSLYGLITNSDIHYVFVKSPRAMARNWRMVANSFGVKTTKIVEGVHPTDDTLSSEIKWYLTLSDLSSFCGKGNSSKKTAVPANNLLVDTIN